MLPANIFPIKCVIALKNVTENALEDNLLARLTAGQAAAALVTALKQGLSTLETDNLHLWGLVIKFTTNS